MHQQNPITHDHPERATDAAVLQILVTEHTNLQAARSATIYEAHVRTNLYLGSVSSAVIALAFIGQVTDMSPAILVFALILLPALLFMGIVTFVRVLQTGWEDSICSRGINRIRHYYMEVAPHMKDYFILSANDDLAGVLRNMGAQASRWQVAMSTAGLVSFINSILAGVFVGLLAATLLKSSIILAVIAGIAVFITSAWLHLRYHTRVYFAMEDSLEVRFPSEDQGQL
jgi:hypothetical protein